MRHLVIGEIVMKSGFLDKLIERLDKLDPENLQAHFLHLMQEKGLLETIFQSIQEGLIVLDNTGHITYANHAAEQLLGFTQEQARGRPIMRYLRDIDWERVLDLDTHEWLKMVRYEIEVRYPQHRFLSFYVVPLIVAEKKTTGAVVILRDITRDRENNATIIESERINAIRMLAAGVAHEIGNPLNALTIHLQLLERELKKRDGDPDGSLSELTGVARKEVSRLDAIIRQFLQALRPTKPQFVSHQIEAVVKDTLAVLQQEIENRALVVELGCPVPVPLLMIDPAQIQQAFFNVIKNALQAMPDGGRLNILITADERFVTVAFTDNGMGIAPEDFGRVFEPYYTTKTNGTGLGLMIVQRIVQEHGGKIAIQSAPKVGTTMAIKLPLDEPRLRLLNPADNNPDATPKELTP